jgi:TonB family protein
MDNTAARRIKGRGSHKDPYRSIQDPDRLRRPNFLLVLLASLAIHITAVLFALYVPESYKKPQKTIEIFNVTVTTLPGPAGGGGKSEEAVKAPLVIKKAVPKEKEKVVIAKKFVEKKQPAKLKKEPERLEAKKFIPEAPKGPGQGPAGGGGKPGKVVGPIAVEGGVDFPYQWYLDALQRKIGDRWRPPSRVYRNNPKVVIRFLIDRMGRIKDVKVDDKGGSSGRDGSSGMWDLDQSAKRAVTEASPVPPLPAGFPGDSLGVHYTFSPEKPS